MDIKNNTSNEFVNETFSESIKKIEKDINLNDWGFKMISLRLYPKHTPRAIFQSKKCFVDFRWHQDISYTYAEQSIYATYARLHAPLDEELMIWNGQKCHCWHNSMHSFINFLDGASPRKLSFQDYITPVILRGFHENKEVSYVGERVAKKTVLIWNHYGDRFFNLLDLQHPELWEKYSFFLKEYYEYQNEIVKLKGHNPVNLDPPLYMVC